MNNYQRGVKRELADLDAYLKDSDSSWTMEVVMHLARAAIFALLAIAEAIQNK